MVVNSGDNTNFPHKSSQNVCEQFISQYKTNKNTNIKK